MFVTLSRVALFAALGAVFGVFRLPSLSYTFQCGGPSVLPMPHNEWERIRELPGIYYLEPFTALVVIFLGIVIAAQILGTGSRWARLLQALGLSALAFLASRMTTAEPGYFGWTWLYPMGGAVIAGLAWGMLRKSVHRGALTAALVFLSYASFLMLSEGVSFGGMGVAPPEGTPLEDRYSFDDPYPIIDDARGGFALGIACGALAWAMWRRRGGSERALRWMLTGGLVGIGISLLLYGATWAALAAGLALPEHVGLGCAAVIAIFGALGAIAGAAVDATARRLYLP